MGTQSNSLSHRIAFYPCCAGDIEEPRFLLREFAEEIVYCDIRKPKELLRASSSKVLPQIRFVRGDALECLRQMEQIDVLFYRRDSNGEGGSALYVLGKPWLSEIVRHMPDSGGRIITDGSNSGSGMFRRMTRPHGYTSKTWKCHLGPAARQPWLQPYKLHIIEVRKLAQQPAGADFDPAAGSKSAQS